MCRATRLKGILFKTVVQNILHGILRENSRNIFYASHLMKGSGTWSLSLKADDEYLSFCQKKTIKTHVNSLITGDNGSIVLYAFNSFFLTYFLEKFVHIVFIRNVKLSMYLSYVLYFF